MEAARYVHYTLWSYKIESETNKCDRANKMDSTVPWILAAISFPVMFGKQIINVVQLVKASKWIAEGDVADRREARRSKKN
jgi:hypothetical protein